MRKVICGLICLMLVGCGEGSSSINCKRDLNIKRPTWDCVNNYHWSDPSRFEFICKDKNTNSVYFVLYPDQDLTFKEILLIK